MRNYEPGRLLWSLNPGIVFHTPLLGYAFWQPHDPCYTCDTVPAWRTDDGGITWNPIHTDVLPLVQQAHGSAGISSNWAFDVSSKAYAFTTTTGDTGWDTLQPFPGELAISVVHDTLPSAGGLPRFMAAFYESHFAGTRLAITTDGGTTWLRTDSVGYTLDANNKPVDSGLVESTLFGSAPVNAKGYFGWVRIIALQDSMLTMLSLQGGYDYAFWEINLVTRQATITPLTVASQLLRDRLINATAARPGMLYSVTYEPRWGEYSFDVSFDMGKTWLHRTDSATVIKALPQFLHFATPGYCITKNYYTHDTGRTWHRWYTPFDLVNFYSIDSLNLVATSSDNIYRSTDGGRSWTPSRPETPAAVFGGDGIVIAKLRDLGFACSHDSAETWSSISLPPNVDRLGSIALVDTLRHPEHLIGIATDDRFDSGAIRTLIVSTDSGHTWSTISNLPDLDNATNISLNFVRTVDRSTTVGILNSSAGLYTSTDKGVTWIRSNGAPQVFTSVAMADEKHGMANRSNTMYRTVDGGATWSSVERLPDTYSEPFGMISFDSLRTTALLPDINQLFSKGRALYTFNGGEDWKYRTSKTGDVGMWNPVYWLDPAQAYCTTMGRILYSNDSGRHFEMLHPGLSFAAEHGVFDGNYLYYFSPDSGLIGRWRVLEKSSSVPDVKIEGKEMMVQVEGNTIVLTPNGIRPEQWQPVLVDMLGRTHSLLWQFDGARWSANKSELPSGCYIVTATSDGVKRTGKVVLTQ